MRFRFVCAAVLLAWPAVPGLAFAQSAPATKASSSAEAPFVLPAWGALQKTAPASPIQLSIRGVAGWFRIGVPAGWQLNADRVSGRIVVNSAGGRGVRVWLMLFPRVVGPEDAASLLAGANAQIAPRAKWSRIVVKRNGPRTTAAAHAREGDVTRATGFLFVPAGRVTVALYATAAAPTRDFDRSRDLFAAVLESFMPLPGFVSGTPGSEKIAFERWTDPVERAFSLDVPKGWKAQGGTVRRAANDVRQVVQVIDPEQAALVQFGDAEIPPFVVPTDGAPEGQASGAGRVMPFQSGPAFGRAYLRARARLLMSDLAVDTVRPLPALQQRLQAIQNAYATGGVERRIEVGELFFHGSWNGRPAKGYLFAATNRVTLPDSGDMWIVGDLGTLQGFMATEDRIATVIAVMDRMRTSFEINPQWFRDNARSVETISRMAAETGRHVADTVAMAFANGQAGEASIHDRYVHYRRDVVPFKAPQQATVYQAQVGSNYYWMGARGLILGTDRHFNPDPLWFRDMLKVDP